MPTFDEIKEVALTPEQGDLHIAALVTHINRMERKLIQVNIRIARHQQQGELALAMKLYEGKKKRLRFIAAAKEELDRFREIFESDYGKEPPSTDSVSRTA